MSSLVVDDITNSSGARPYSVTVSAEQAHGSGSAIDFDDIPSGTSRIIIMFEGISLSGTDSIIVQLGSGEVFETTGYVSAGANQAGSVVTSTAGFVVRAGAASELISGHMILTLSNSTNNTWISSNMCTKGDGCVYSGGNKDLSGTLDSIRITRTGTDSFDSGAVAIQF